MKWIAFVARPIGHNEYATERHEFIMECAVEKAKAHVSKIYGVNEENIVIIPSPEKTQ